MHKLVDIKVMCNFVLELSDINSMALCHICSLILNRTFLFLKRTYISVHSKDLLIYFCLFHEGYKNCVLVVVANMQNTSISTL